MELVKVEAKNPVAPSKNWPVHRIREILETLVNAEESPAFASVSYGKYCKNLDVLEITLKQLGHLQPAGDLKNDPVKASNFLALFNLLDLGKNVLNAAEYHVPEKPESRSFSYEQNRKKLNQLWQATILASSGVDEKLHRQILVVLLERVINHLEDPIQQTDFLMDSLHQMVPLPSCSTPAIFMKRMCRLTIWGPSWRHCQESIRPLPPGPSRAV
ncbi:hypothetical protein KR009_010740 [Drosophila setifemur]|nr:hypothetical protein KR009_010740 [Drosophila setifemur]